MYSDTFAVSARGSKTKKASKVGEATMLKKISSVVAAVAMTLTGLGALPAQAVNYAPNADSNIISSSWRKTTGTDSVISVPSTGVQRASFRRQWTFDGTAASQVVGKTITVSYTVTAPDGSAVAGSGNLYLSGYMTNLQTQGDLYFNENTPGTGLVTVSYTHLTLPTICSV